MVSVGSSLSDRSPDEIVGTLPHLTFADGFAALADDQTAGAFQAKARPAMPSRARDSFCTARTARSRFSAALRAAAQRRRQAGTGDCPKQSCGDNAVTPDRTFA